MEKNARETQHLQFFLKQILDGELGGGYLEFKCQHKPVGPNELHLSCKFDVKYYATGDF